MKSIHLFILALAFPILSSAQTLVTAEKVERMEEFIQLLEKENQIGGAISITVKGQNVYSRTFGISKDKYGDSSPETTYQIGSITKMFTAVMVAQLVEEDKLTFDTKLQNYFPDVANSEQITIKQMLNHTSGLGDYVVKEDSLYYWLFEPQTEAEILREITRQGALFMPGDSMEYSNSAYYLLARIIEKENKMNFKQSVQKRIATPLGLTLTSGVDADQDFSGVALPFSKKDGVWEEAEDFYFLNASGAGDIFSTPSEMNQFIRGLHKGKLISTETLKSMLPSEDEWFGMGFMKVPFYDHVGIGHGGDTFGTHSVTAYFEEDDLAITYSINAEYYPTNEFAVGILSIIYEREFEFPEFSHYQPDRLFYKSYAGTYASDDLPIDISIFTEDGELKAQGEGQPSFVLTPTAEHAFQFLPAGVTIVFSPTENKLVFSQGGMEFEMVKK